ncbi:hypothetical protein I5R65_21760 [Herbaspirillum sp. AP02]|uniref:TRAFAC clade GTPase domain-containing protein n=1 Tax=unclassified Herbaspirillum TaxID=2624150 RepID=UPI0015DBC18A|nr:MULTISPECIES: hypothetical protein [unclassified Herbaspirillum]MBG7622107.1 hypothetical protein [Herbaspirillum sp. AP02]NZD69126.1 hypothetical protein [Herbaspirillum sp. AP21]
MAEKSVVVIGLPESGKTTYLAAFWHVLLEADINSKLKFSVLRSGNTEHLNQIADLWRQAHKQERTSVSGDRVVNVMVRDDDGNIDSVSFPDVAGEAFRQMWEERECDQEISRMILSNGVMFFIHADTIKAPGWIVDDRVQSENAGIAYETENNGIPLAWTPRMAPTQVQVIDLLQSLQNPPFDVGPRKLALVLSAWDTVEAEKLSPKDYLAKRMPLLRQYLTNGLNDGWTFRIYGISAQGGDYDKKSQPTVAADNLRELSSPTERIKVEYDGNISHDLTEPLHWLLR